MKSRRLMGYLRRGSHPTTSVMSSTLCITANFDRQSPVGVKLGKSKPEHIGSASHPKADMGDRRSVPGGDLSRCSKSWSFDHLVGPQQKRRRNGYSQRVSSSHVEYSFEFRRPFDRQFTRIGATQDFASKDTGQPMQAE